MTPDGREVRLLACGAAGAGTSTLIRRLTTPAVDARASRPQALASAESVADADGAAWPRPAWGDPTASACAGSHRFASERRSYVVVAASASVALTPDFAACASSADAALIVLDARAGLSTRTRMYARILRMFAVRRLIVVVNKMDLVGFDRAPFEAIAAELGALFPEPAPGRTIVLPASALSGDNVRQTSRGALWHAGPSLLGALDSIEVDELSAHGRFRLPVSAVGRGGDGAALLFGRVAGGAVRPGDEVRLLPSGLRTRVTDVLVEERARASASDGEAVALTLADGVGAVRGDVVAAAEAPPEVADQFEAHLLWTSEHPMTPGRQYLMQLAASEVSATVTEIKYREDADTGAHLAAKTLAAGELATVNLSTGAALAFEPCAVGRALGSFVLKDKLSSETVGVGAIVFALRRAQNIHWQALALDKAARAALKHQRPLCIWLTGLSGAGKSTIANLLEHQLSAQGRHTYLLDGDNVRHGLNRDLGFTEADRVENIRRIAEVARLMVDAGLIVVTSFISPFRSERRMARELFSEGEFVEVFVDAPLAECERRDTKGLYAKARLGQLRNFTGIDSAYEPPEKPEVHLWTARQTPSECVDEILHRLG